MEKLAEFWTHPSPIVLSTVALGLSSIGYVILKSRSGPPKGLQYPPGPPQYPVIGSLASFPKDDMYAAYVQWQKLYGDIVYIPLPGVSMIVINSLDVAHELLSKRGNNNSGRWVPYMTGQLLGWNWSLVFRQADSTHQLMRKMFRRGIGPQRVPSHDPVLEKSTDQLLLKLKDFHGNPTNLVLDTIAHIIIEITYGEEIWTNHGAELVTINLEAMSIVSNTFSRLWLVDLFNFLRFIPSWMPGAEFRRRGIRSTKLADRIHDWPYKMSQNLYDSKRLGHSLISDLFDEFGQTQEVKDATGILFTLGSDTTSSAIVHFLHCMFMFPEIAAKVQKEIDSVIGDRLPKVVDREHLPYTEAVWKESLRWKTAIPLAVPHTNVEDEVINGFFIPKGSVINPNLGFMLSDPKIWGDPSAFRPERHLESHDPPLPNPTSIAFGFGLRVCPGRDVANRAGFYIVSAIMAMYEILPLDGKSIPDPDTAEYTVELIQFPKEFDCRFVPRSEKARNILSGLV